MTGLTDLQHRLALLIEGEIALLHRFIGVLEREEALLIAGDTDTLLALTREKNEVYQLLQRQHDNRALLLGRAGRPNKDASIRELCAALPATLAGWGKVLELAADARARNELNGKLISERMQHNQAALTVLLTAAEKPQLYDAEGVARPTSRGRHLGSA